MQSKNSKRSTRKLTNPFIRAFWRGVFGVEYVIRYYTITPYQTRYGRRETGTYEWVIVEVSPFGNREVASNIVKRKESAKAEATAKLEEILNGKTDI